MLKKENGVTLVALVITIIVLLILAGVTLAMVMGDSGIFTKAQTASDETSKANARDAVKMAVLDVTVNSYDDNGVRTPIADESALITAVNAQLNSVGEGYSVDGTTKKVMLNNDETGVTCTFTKNDSGNWSVSF